jgi:2-haloalkanoic acid dehalogenase type II
MLENDFEIITFDCYGTLIDWEGGITRAFQSEAARQAITPGADEIIAAYMAEEPAVESSSYKSYRAVLTETAERVAARLGLALPRERAGFLADSLPDWLPFPDTNSALERLSRRYKLGLLSNTDDDLLQETRRHFTVGFDLIVTAQQVRSYKPAPAHFREAGKRLGAAKWLHAAQSYYHDVMPATAMGIPVVWVNRKGEAAADGGPRPTEEVSDMARLADLLGV